MASDNVKQGWKNPTDVMRVHRMNKRKSNQKEELDFNADKMILPANQTLKSNQRKATFKAISSSDEKGDANNVLKKRKNPFMLEQNLPSKQLKIQKNQESEAGQKLLTHQAQDVDVSSLSGTLQTSGGTKSSQMQEEPFSDKKLEGGQAGVLGELHDNFHPDPLNASHNSSASSDNNQKLHASLPLDWSLRLKMRVVTNAESLKGKLPGLEARNLHAFVHNQFSDEEWHNLDAVSQIRRCCHHYCFPNIPGITKFPRLSSHYGNKLSPMETSRQEVLDALQSEWSKAFMSVYQQLRSSLCPYFYVCTHQFTALFRCLRSEDKCFLNVVLSPTTRGFRELLKQEGITFHMPRVKQHFKETKDKKSEVPSGVTVASKKSCSRENISIQDNTQVHGQNISRLDCTGDHSEVSISAGKDSNFEHTERRESRNTSEKSKDKDDDEEEDDDDDDDELDSPEDGAASSWLEEIGLESKHFPSLLPQNVKVQKERFQDIDNRLQSVIYLEGLNVHAFFNFLHNYSSCIANSGPQYGLPPTILSPSPFQGGALIVNTVKQSTIQDVRSIKHSQADLGKEKNQVLEINGPILPHHTLNVASILKSKACSSSMSFSLHPPTTAFNMDVTDDMNKDNILLSGLKKLLVPFSSLELGLLPDVKGSLLTESSISLKEVSVSTNGITCIS